MLDPTFSIGNIIQLVILLGTLIAAYWKLSTRMSLLEQRTGHLENQAATNEGKLEKRLDAIDSKIDDLIIAVTKLKARTEG